jgi:hypothetical protein
MSDNEEKAVDDANEPITIRVRDQVRTWVTVPTAIQLQT